MLREIIKAKRSQLENKRPNILAVNTLFNVDLQTINWNILNVSGVNFNGIDSLLFFADGIDNHKVTIKGKIINPTSPSFEELSKAIHELLD